jgi:hypothetical protein
MKPVCQTKKCCFNNISSSRNRLYGSNIMRDQKGHLMMTNESNYKSEITILNLHKSRNTVNKIQQK